MSGGVFGNSGIFRFFFKMGGGSTTTRVFLMDPGKGGVSGIYGDNSGVPVSFFFVCDVNVASVFLFGFVGSLWCGLLSKTKFNLQHSMKSMMTNFPPRLQTIWSPHSLRKKSSQWPDVLFGYDLEECNKNKHVNKGEMFISFPSFFVGCILSTHKTGRLS